MKDNFSSASDKYAHYRPSYPPELFEFINSNIIEKKAAWDCGTGNGQVAFELAKSFTTVFATDISRFEELQTPNLAITLSWTTAAFLEEILFKGYFIHTSNLKHVEFVKLNFWRLGLHIKTQ